MKYIITTLSLLLSLQLSAQHKGAFKWLGSVAQGGNGGAQEIIIDTPNNTYTLYGKNYAISGYDPVSTQCPNIGSTIKTPHYIYRTYDNQHNLIKTGCVRTPMIFDSFYQAPFYTERTTDGHFIYVAQTTNDSLYLCKADSLGTIVWVQDFDLGINNGVEWISKTNEGHYLFGCTAYTASGMVPAHYGSGFSEDYFLFETDTLGTIYFASHIGGTGKDVKPVVLKKKQSKGYIFKGETNSSDFDFSYNNCERPNCADHFIMVLDSAGNSNSFERYNGSDPYGLVHEDNDDIVYFRATAKFADVAQINTSKAFQILKVDSTGEQVWQKQYGFTGNLLGQTTSQQTLKDYFGIISNPINNGYVIWGYHEYIFDSLGDVQVALRGKVDTWVIFLDSHGNLEGQLTYGGSKDDYINDIKYYPGNKSFLALGISNSYDYDFGTGYHFDTTTNNGESFISEIAYWPVGVKNTEKIIKPLIKAYPNPAQGILYIEYDPSYHSLDKELALSNMNGQLVQQSHSKDVGQDQLEISQLPNGIYFLSIEHDNERLFLEKIIIKSE